MNYQLAQKLKDAGYPQTEGHYPRYFGKNDEDSVRCPTLSELIEACVALNPNGTFEIRWHISDGKYHGKVEASSGVFRDGQGDTPEEAVANLWIELNKK